MRMSSFLRALRTFNTAAVRSAAEKEPSFEQQQVLWLKRGVIITGLIAVAGGIATAGYEFGWKSERNQHRLLVNRVADRLRSPTEGSCLLPSLGIEEQYVVERPHLLGEILKQSRFADQSLIVFAGKKVMGKSTAIRTMVRHVNQKDKKWIEVSCDIFLCHSLHGVRLTTVGADNSLLLGHVSRQFVAA